MGRFWSFVRDHHLLSGLAGSAVVAAVAVAALLSRPGDGKNDRLTTGGLPTETAPAQRWNPSPSVTASSKGTPIPTREAPTATAEPMAMPSGVARLESPMVLEESLDRPGDADEWVFAGSRGQFVEVRVDRDPTGNVRPAITIRDPFGERAANANSAWVKGEEYARLEYWLESTGEFTVEVEDRAGEGIGGYRLAFNIDPFTEISPGQVILGEISRSGEKDRYRFIGQPGQTAKIRVQRDPAGNMKPAISLFDPFGDREGNANSAWNDDEYAELERELRDSGHFMVVVEDRSDTGSGKYTLEFTLR